MDYLKACDENLFQKPFKCDISDCDKAYVSSTKLKRHQKTFHKSDGGDGGEGEINTAAAQEDGEGNIQPALVTTTDGELSRTST